MARDAADEADEADDADGADAAGRAPAAPRPDVRFLLLPLPEFALLPFGGFVDKLRFSADEADRSRQRYCTWQILGLEHGEVVASSGVAVAVQRTPDEVRLADYDYLVVFGSRTAAGAQALAPEYGGLLRQAAAQGLTLVGIDNAAFLLAAAGLLNASRVAIHWRHVAEFREAFPRIDIRPEQLYCIDRKRITCAGGSAAIDLAVELLARHSGRARALKGLADMLVDRTRSELHRLESLEAEADAGRHVGRAIGLMRNLLAENITTEDLARRIGVSRRQLDRLFRERFDQTAKAYWNEMRLQQVRWRLLNSDHPLSVLADEVGIPDSSDLCRRFRRRFGQSPGQARAAGGDNDRKPAPRRD